MSPLPRSNFFSFADHPTLSEVHPESARHRRQHLCSLVPPRSGHRLRLDDWHSPAIRPTHCLWRLSRRLGDCYSRSVAALSSPWSLDTTLLVYSVISHIVPLHLQFQPHLYHLGRINYRAFSSPSVASIRSKRLIQPCTSFFSLHTVHSCNRLYGEDQPHEEILPDQTPTSRGSGLTTDERALALPPRTSFRCPLASNHQLLRLDTTHPTHPRTRPIRKPRFFSLPTLFIFSILDLSPPLISSSLSDIRYSTTAHTT